MKQPTSRRSTLSAMSIGLLLFCASLGDAAAQPVGRYPDAEGAITNIMMANATEKKDGLLATASINGAAVPVQVTTQTKLQIQKGKLVERGTVADLRIGDRVSAWFKEPVGPNAKAAVKADTLIIFRPGTGGVPLPPKGP